MMARCLMSGAQNSVSVPQQDVAQHNKPQPQQMHQGYHQSLPPQQSPYMTQPGMLRLPSNVMTEVMQS